MSRFDELMLEYLSERTTILCELDAPRENDSFDTLFAGVFMPLVELDECVDLLITWPAPAPLPEDC